MRLSESEWQIMNALWSRHPATAREVAEMLPEEVSWAYTTIKTMLTPTNSHLTIEMTEQLEEPFLLVVVGEFNSGKSTFIRTFNALEDFQRGSITVDGIPLSDDLRNIDAIRREVLTKLNAAKGGGMIFQSDHSVSSNVSGHTYDYVVNLVRKYGVYPLHLEECDLDMATARG